MLAILSLRTPTTEQSHFLATHTFPYFLYTQSKGRHRIAVVRSLVGNSKIQRVLTGVVGLPLTFLPLSNA